MGTEAREILKKLLYVLSLSFLGSIFISYKAWFSLGSFPAISVLPWHISPIIFQFFSVVLIALVFIQPIFFYERTIYRIILLLLLILFFLNHNLIQPWAWMYFILLWIISSFARFHHQYKDLSPIVSTLKIAVSLIYVFSGIFKIHPNFETLVLPYLLQPLTQFFWQFESQIIAFFSLAPFIEILLGFGLLIPSANRWIKLGLILMHIIIMLLIGPFTGNLNPVIWPWNIGMIAILLILFPFRKNKQPLFPLFFILFKKPFYYPLLVMILFTGLHFFGLGNGYMAFDLYSGRITNKQASFNSSSIKAVPENINNYAWNYGNSIYIDYYVWCNTELKIPPCPAAICDSLYKKSIEKRLK